LAKRRYSRARRYYARLKGRAKKMTIPIGPVAGILGAPAVGYAIGDIMRGDVNQALNNVKSIVGITPSGTFDLGLVKVNMTPVIVGLLAHKFIGGTLGVNRALGAAHVPLIRI